MSDQHTRKTGEKSPVFIIYRIDCSVTKLVYVGVTCQSLRKRWIEHLSIAKRLYRRGWLQLAFEKFGPQSFSISEITRCATKTEALVLEKLWIGKLNTLWPNGYNKASHCSIHYSWKHTEEAKRKIAISKIGKHPSEETRKKLSDWQKGIAKSDEHKNRIRSSMTGRKHSEAAKEKIGAFRIGMVYTEAHRAAISAGIKRAKALKRTV